MKKTSFGFVVLVVLFLCFSPNFVVYSSEYTPVEYCELINNPSQYNGKKIRVEANYRYGFEWSELICEDCFELQKRTWVDFDKLDESCSSKKLLKKLKKDSPEGRTLAVVFAGTFENSKKSYGHLNEYQFKLNVSCVEKAVVLLEDSPLPKITAGKP
jgi:hypothetical protein